MQSPHPGISGGSSPAAYAAGGAEADVCGASRRRTPPSTSSRCGRRRARPGGPENTGAQRLSARGYDLLGDAVDFGRLIFPLVRQEAARRDREAAERGPHLLEKITAGI
ncbi:hypothetical protein HD597_003220 [Nonomuraea thailandensis]|uniref:Uncharacterized protein n=1 Tax=Nonomuraea thailandensis TaxID=1188745 RepID=A0A9X2K1P7_9ACTN|nr:hypothetical protein [Nonomuraea thailandensis]MCP2356200.1 hypothetical protein [Nonomuraea thailandensis]